MLKYEVIIYWSEPDNTFLAEVPELPGCIADGPSMTEALTAVEQVAEEWIDTASRLAREIPQPRGRLMFA